MSNLNVVLHSQDEATLKTAELIGGDLTSAAEKLSSAASGIAAALLFRQLFGDATHTENLNAIDQANIAGYTATRDVLTHLLRRLTVDPMTILAIEATINEQIVAFTYQLQDDAERRAGEQEAIDTATQIAEELGGDGFSVLGVYTNKGAVQFEAPGQGEGGGIVSGLEYNRNVG